jgi:hypothetical protein
MKDIEKIKGKMNPKKKEMKEDQDLEKEKTIKNMYTKKDIILKKKKKKETEVEAEVKKKKIKKTIKNLLIKII